MSDTKENAPAHHRGVKEETKNTSRTEQQPYSNPLTTKSLIKGSRKEATMANIAILPTERNPRYTRPTKRRRVSPLAKKKNKKTAHRGT